MTTITAYRDKWELTFPVSNEQFEQMDSLIAQLELAGYSATRPYTPKEETDVDGIFLRYEERTDGKKGFHAIVKSGDKEHKVIQFQKMLVPNLAVTIYSDEKGYRQLRLREAPNF